MSEVRTYFPDVIIAAFTATATKRTREDIINQLKFSSNRPEKFKMCMSRFNRPEIFYHVETKSSVSDKTGILKWVQQHKEQCGIIYVNYQKDTADLQDYLYKQHKIESQIYHAGLPTSDRLLAQNAFQSGSCKLMIATTAFGMGIDKGDIRYVLHYNIPRSVEEYYQQTGRAGRDGKSCDVVMYYHPADYQKLLKQTERDTNISDVTRNNVIERLDAMRQFCVLPGRMCRRSYLLSVFDETYAGNCGACDRCILPPQISDDEKKANDKLLGDEKDGSQDAIIILKAIDTKLSFVGESTVVKRLTSEYVSNLTQKACKSLLQQLRQLGYLDHTMRQFTDKATRIQRSYTSLTVTDQGLNVLTQVEKGFPVTIMLRYEKQRNANSSSSSTITSLAKTVNNPKLTKAQQNLLEIHTLLSSTNTPSQLSSSSSSSGDITNTAIDKLILQGISTCKSKSTQTLTMFLLGKMSKLKDLTNYGCLRHLNADQCEQMIQALLSKQLITIQSCKYLNTTYNSYKLTVQGETMLRN